MAGEQINLFYGLLDAVDTLQTRAACIATLSSVEKQHAERFKFEQHRRQYILAHGLLRAALSSLLPDVEPTDWSFVANSHGRPFVAAPIGPRPIFFSLSHTDGCVACVVSSCEAVGVDVEKLEEERSIVALADGGFSAEEIDTLQMLPPSDRVERFFDCWTLKEAYIKARSMGLSLPLKQISIRISPDQKIAIRFAPEVSDDPQRWCFMRISPSPKHRLAVADGSGLPGGMRIAIQPWPFSSS